MNVLSLFAGIGGLDLGLERAGMTVVGQVEIDPYRRAVLAKHWPEVPRHDDVETAIAWWRSARRPRVDVVAGGFPCQPVSQAGPRRAQMDERWLWPAMASVVADLRPEWVVWENVPGLLTGGLDIVHRGLVRGCPVLQGGGESRLVDHMWHNGGMSQKVRITRVSVIGAAPFLGLRDGAPYWSRRPGEVMDWLADGWRTRFNQFRSRRQRYGPGKVLTPLGGAVNTDTLPLARKAFSWLTAIPDLVLQSPEKIENGEWWAAIKRRETMRQSGRDPGAMPRFLSRKRSDQTFACWFNGGRNAVLTRVGRKSGIVTISGSNPTDHRQTGQPARFRIRLHVRLSQPIRPYTSVRVNWTTKTLVFVNEPAPLSRVGGPPVGVDRGVVHNLATSDGAFHDLPRQRLRQMDSRVRLHQRRASRARHRWMGDTGGAARDWRPSKRAATHLREATRLRARAVRIVTDYQHKATTTLVREHDVIVTERLQLASMTRRGRGKRGLNRVIAGAAMGRVQRMLTYKSEAADTALIEVPARYTSQRCHQCGHIAPENRESQAAFRCHQCGHTDNADTNAAKNILWLWEHDQGAGLARRVEQASDTPTRVSGRGAAASKRQPPALAGIPRL